MKRIALTFALLAPISAHAQVYNPYSEYRSPVYNGAPLYNGAFGQWYSQQYSANPYPYRTPQQNLPYGWISPNSGQIFGSGVFGRSR